MSAATEYDAIVIGGGHNGLVNAAYLAKSRLRTLILERRHTVGGAAITEELRPGFKFTTFSYALSLLRPDIIHDLNLVQHGFMPLLMPSTFCPMENGDSLVMGQDRGENIKEIARHSKRDADAYDQYSHDITMVIRAVKPLFDSIPPNLWDESPEGLGELASLARHLRGIDKPVLHNLVRLLTGSAADSWRLASASCRERSKASATAAASAGCSATTELRSASVCMIGKLPVRAK